MNQRELKKKVEQMLKKGNKVSEEQVSKYGFVFEKGFEAHEVKGKCADEYDGVRRHELIKNKLCRVKIGDPIVFDAYYEGKVELRDYEKSYSSYDDNDYREFKSHFDFYVFEQNGKYAIVGCDENETKNYIDFDFQEFEVEEYLELIE